jgi:hypothetical protein
MISEPGDYIGGGMTFSLTPADGTISAERQSAVVSVSFSAVPPFGASPKTFWFFHFAPLEGGALATGNYASAQRWPFQSPRRPGLDVSGDGRGCNTLTGKFTVYEATFDAGGNVIAFAADAEQHCEGAAPALRVHLRFNSGVPLQLHNPQAIAGLPQEVYERALVTLDGSQSFDPDGHIAAWHWSQVSGPPATIESPDASVTLFRAPHIASGGADLRFQLDVLDDVGNAATSTVDVHVFDRHDRRNLLTWRSPPGDYIGQGKTLTFTNADGDVLLGNAYPGQLSVQAGFSGGASNNWTLDFAAPDGAPLAASTYTDAQRFPFQSTGTPGLSVYGSGRGCNTLTGQFTVLEIDKSIAPAQFGARFVQSCEGFMPPLRGTVLVDAIAPGNPVARIAGPPTSLPGATVTLDASGSSSTGSSLVAYQWRQISGPPVSISDPSLSQITFTMPAVPGSLRFELEVTDEDSLVDAGSIDVAAPSVGAAAIPTLDPRLLAVLISAIAMLGALIARRGGSRTR